MVDGSTLDLSAASGAVFPDLLSVTAGALSLGALNATDQNVLQQTGGTIAGSGTLTVFGGSALTGGVQTGPGVTVLNGTSTLGGTFALDGGRTLANDGWLNWSSGNIALGSGDVGCGAAGGDAGQRLGAVRDRGRAARRGQRRQRRRWTTAACWRCWPAPA